MELNKVDDKTAYENLLIKYAELENQIADIKANCDLAIEGRDVKIKELEQEHNKLLDVINNQDVKIADLEKENAELKEELKNWKDEWQEQVQKAIDEGYARILQTMQLTNAKEVIKGSIVLLTKPRTALDTKTYLMKAEQFLKEIEK